MTKRFDIKNDAKFLSIFDHEMQNYKFHGEVKENLTFIPEYYEVIMEIRRHLPAHINQPIDHNPALKAFFTVLNMAAVQLVMDGNKDEILELAKEFVSHSRSQMLDPIRGQIHPNVQVEELARAKIDFSPWSEELGNDKHDYFWDFVADDAVGIFSTLSEEIPIAVLDYDEEVHDAVIVKVDEYIGKLSSGEIALENAYDPEDLQKIVNTLPKKLTNSSSNITSDTAYKISAATWDSVQDSLATNSNSIIYTTNCT